MGRGMNIRAIKLRLATTRGDFGFRFEFGRGLTVVRGSNSSGKSTLFNCLMYGLGMEELVGGRGAKALPYAVKDYFLQGDVRVEVVASEVFIELENSVGQSITLRRAIRDTVRNSKLIEVFDGATLTISANTHAVYARKITIHRTGRIVCIGATTFRVTSVEGLRRNLIDSVKNVVGSAIFHQ